ncbi:MAG: hypothetical protein AB1585_10520, partial [Thermodesulfobacteriota bacterium]
FRSIGCSATEGWPYYKLGGAERPDLRRRLPKGVGQEASFLDRPTASEWMPFQKLDKVERPDRSER